MILSLFESTIISRSLDYSVCVLAISRVNIYRTVLVLERITFISFKKRLNV